MPKLMHRQYDWAFLDRPTRIRFTPEKTTVDGESKTVVAADVPEEHVEDLLSRGFEPFPASGDQIPVDGELPADFPGVKELKAAGVATLEAVAAKSDDELLAISGIGPALVKKIRKYGK